ncbi:unnamed protein product [Heligmosomoides polygyrus]|uniref:Uncharacterized protein n=1 Tax=Heligmosomoides polygyrus TaxID=6339 RepID=A0A183FLX9_HELPZ|nr:unnamed protein product [Heligmosomoides polygyrus]
MDEKSGSLGFSEIWLQVQQSASRGELFRNPAQFDRRHRAPNSPFSDGGACMGSVDDDDGDALGARRSSDQHPYSVFRSLYRIRTAGNRIYWATFTIDASWSSSSLTCHGDDQELLSVRLSLPACDLWASCRRDRRLEMNRSCLE